MVSAQAAGDTGAEEQASRGEVDDYELQAATGGHSLSLSAFYVASKLVANVLHLKIMSLPIMPKHACITVANKKRFELSLNQ